MSMGPFTEDRVSSEVFAKHYQLGNIMQAYEDNMVADEEIAKLVGSSADNSKLNFLKSIGLEFSNYCDINCDINYNNNNVDYDLQMGHKRTSSRLSEKIGGRFDDIPQKSFDWATKSKHKSSTDSKTRNMAGHQKIIPVMRECSVTIIGEKCKICGKGFKCIRDVQTHMKKKHRRKKPRKKLVLKIGDEVISTVSIKRKHLKGFHKQKQQTIDSSNDAMSVCDEDLSSGHICDEEIATLDDLSDTNDSWPRLLDIDSRSAHRCSEHSPRLDFEKLRKEEDEDIKVPHLLDIGRSSVHRCSEHSSRLDFEKLRKDEDEDIKVLLRITKPLKSLEINHETPNRSERDQLITDAIREFVDMDVEVIEPVHDLQAYRENHEIIEELNRLNDSRLQFGNLDREERNCSFHIENEDDIDCNQEVNSLLAGNNDKYFNDDAAFTHSQHYRNENGDIIPAFIDYTHCLDDRVSLHNNNNNVYDMESPFYNEARINEWNKAVCDPKPMGFDIHQNLSRSLNSSVLIKEEIMLDDLLL